MDRPRNLQPVAALLLGLVVVLGWSGAAVAAAPDLLVVPDLVEIGAFFQGQEVGVSGEIPPGTEAVLEVMGRNAPEKLMRKGRRGGLWMNVGELEISGAPSLYLVMSTKAELLAAPETEVPWGYPCLRSKIIISGQVHDGERAELQKQFLELKESEKLYAMLPGSLKVSSSGGDNLKVKGTFPLPANVKPDTYKVCLSAVQHGKVLTRQCTDLQVQMVGFPALLSALAYEHGALYGILAVVLAIVTGFVMGYLFKGGGGH